MTSSTRGALNFSTAECEKIDPYIPPPGSSQDSRPHVTLTYATSLDSNLSIAPGVQTLLSGPESKSMTHYLRSRHDAILIGAGTAIADDPSLNCRIEGVGGYGGDGLDGQPRPVVLDPNGRWNLTDASKIIKLAREGRGRAPWVFAGHSFAVDKQRAIERVGGKVFLVTYTDPQASSGRLGWTQILSTLAKEGIKSVMVEGGGVVINDLLSSNNIQLVDSVIITIAPTWLGRDGVQVCPPERAENGQRVPVGRLKEVKWIPLGDDVVLCGRPNV
ncbi:5-amino-6-uracil reductase-like protein [Aaosphaeria arxii CBS 175.79]|uniref:2,5-diamino-6-ribosylamino-4(3H)-pyrimidinone 5'-phosphate reductase n=1 Tax=Aaosphaeria arxii CBS 175.79 TaxID=1450172 RepID=A0A6A5Y718_9PLEO|nr:5-amino-6-uracil reductase-like protein [Aaosphaeria arxii CBS 175.79]KAF2021013.1 5-amino-6-uracil reductase-like protein [Aaosphaeria arxii CBS 175.79]